MNIIIISDALAGFPYGYANTRYMNLVSKSLVKHGASVYLPIVGWSKTIFDAATPVCGNVNGIQYEHLSGKVSGTFSFIMRQWLKARSMYMLYYRLFGLYKQGKIDVVIYQPYFFHYQNTVYRLCKRMKIPLLVHFMEWPMARVDISSKERDFFQSSYDRALAAADGFIMISSYLVERCMDADRRLKRTRPCLRLPILLDKDPWSEVQQVKRNRPYFLYCASLDGYLPDALFLLKAFALSESGGHDLIMVGAAKTATTLKLNEEMCKLGISSRVVIMRDYIAEKDLLGLYCGATALLAPLKDDDRSRARFPSKLADYLFSGVPVVTNPVGEIPEYLVDSHSAFIALTDDAEAFAHKMNEAATHPNRNEIAERGKLTADKFFSLEIQGLRLLEFIRTFCKSLSV